MRRPAAMLVDVFAPHPTAPARSSPVPGPAVPGSVGGALGLPAGVAAVLLTWLLGGDPSVGLVLAGAAVAGLGAQTSVAGGAVAAVQCWACLDGFVVNRLGTLAADRVDLIMLGVVVGVALAARAMRRMIDAGRGAYPVLRLPHAFPEPGRVADPA